MRLLLIILFCYSNPILAIDSNTVFTYKEFIDIVKKHHPISFQASLKIKKGEAKHLKSKGNFDPKLEGEITQKYYDNKQYYSNLKYGLKIPSWFGVTFQTGYLNNQGIYLNPESNNPNLGLWYAGVAIELGNGLIIDKRRAEIKQAIIYQNSSYIEKSLILNQLVFDASNAYYNWYKTYNKYLIYLNAVNNASIRLDNVRNYVIWGDKPSIDTLKAKIQLQNMQINLQKSKQELYSKKTFLETFLWEEGYIPLEIDTIIKPESFLDSKPSHPKNILTGNIDSLIENHPKILYYNNDISINKIEYRLKKENLKPNIQIKYNAINQHTATDFIEAYTYENYNWGIKASYPIFTRKQRGDLKLAEIEINEKENNLLLLKAEVKYKIKTTYNNWWTTFNQVDIFSETLQNYIRLYESEFTLFQNQ